MDNKNKSEYNKYIVKNNKNKKATKKTRTKKDAEDAQKNVAKAAEWGKRWEKKRKQVSQLQKRNRSLR